MCCLPLILHSGSPELPLSSGRLLAPRPAITAGRPRKRRRLRKLSTLSRARLAAVTLLQAQRTGGSNTVKRQRKHPATVGNPLRAQFKALGPQIKLGENSTSQLLPSKRPGERRLNLTGATSTWRSVSTVSPDTNTKGTLTTADLRTPMLSPVAETHSLEASLALTT